MRQTQRLHMRQRQRQRRQQQQQACMRQAPHPPTRAAPPAPAARAYSDCITRPDRTELNGALWWIRAGHARSPLVFSLQQQARQCDLHGFQLQASKRNPPGSELLQLMTGGVVPRFLHNQHSLVLAVALVPDQRAAPPQLQAAAAVRPRLAQCQGSGGGRRLVGLATAAASGCCRCPPTSGAI